MLAACWPHVRRVFFRFLAACWPHVSRFVAVYLPAVIQQFADTLLLICLPSAVNLPAAGQGLSSSFM